MMRKLASVWVVVFLVGAAWADAPRRTHDITVDDYFIQADLFSWAPNQRYDFVFFGFWLSHMPRERFELFWSVVADSLAPAGRVFFVDDNARTPHELIEGESSTTIVRRLNDGTGFRLVKVPYTPAGLEERLGRLGWRITVTPACGPFFWGAGSADPTRGTGRG